MRPSMWGFFFISFPLWCRLIFDNIFWQIDENVLCVHHLERNKRVTRHRMHEYKQPNRVNTHACIKHVLSICPNAQNIADQTREQKKCFRCFRCRVQILPKLPNTLKHVWTAQNKVVKRKNVLRTNNVLACFTVKHPPFGLKAVLKPKI